jgi:hypothetical protein
MAHQDTLPAVELERDGALEMNAQFEAEKKAFWAMREQLLDQYEGQYVAVHQGRIIDHDSDKLRLGLRVYQQFGYRPIYAQLVSRQGLLTRRLASPRRLERQ